MSQPGFGPPSLPVGTEVSAKYRGAFCEAKVKTVVRVVKCKVVMKDCQTSIFVTDEEIKGSIMLGSAVEVKHPETGQPVEGTINKLIDHSSYTVVFDDGDERTLRRSQLCLKGDKHFIESETLDNLPLSHPEHFGTPVLQNKKTKRKNDDESGDDGEDGSEEESPRRAMYRGRHQELVGKLMLVDFPNRKGSVIPALVVLPDANSLNEVKNRDQILVRSFKDSKFLTVTRKVLKDFSRPVAIKNDDKTMRTAFEKALLYYDTKELPVGWNKEEMLGSDIDDDGDEDVDDEYASEDEPFEEKDRFVAQLYKFMDERGTPINKGPCIANKDLNLYKLYKIVEKLGGYNKVTKEMKWPVVYSKMGLPSLHQNPAHQIKSAYKKYLDAFESFYRKLGSTMGTMSRPGRGRQSTGGRSILNPRTKEKSPRTPKPPEKVTQNKDEAENVKQKSEVTPDKLEETQDAATAATTSAANVPADDEDVVMRRTPRRDAKAQPQKDEIKEKKEETEKAKKEEKKEEPLKNKKEEKKDEPLKNKKEEKKDEPLKNKKEEKKDEPLKNKKEEKKDESPVVKSKKEETPTSKIKNEENTPSSKMKKDEPTRVKKDDDSAKKEERKSTRKAKGEEDKEGEKDEKKSARGNKKQKEDESKEEIKQEITTPVKDSPKKRITRRKLLPTEPKKEPEVKEETEEQKEQAKKPVIKENKTVEKKDKEIPRTLERRDSRVSDKKEPTGKIMDKKEVKPPSEKKIKSSEEKKPKKEKKGKEDEEDEGSDDNRNISNVACSEEEEESDQDKSESNVKLDYPIGSRLRVKYGRGKNQKIYIAKVVDFGKEGAHKTYLVHYAGWNTRYDEWIRPDRVVSVLERPDGSKARTPPLRSPSFPGCLKKSPLTNSPTNTPKTLSDLDKSGQIFRTPKIMAAKTRATRSSSSDTSVADKKTGKRMTRRHSILTDSTGSKSPGSTTASDADDVSDSERADDEEVDDDDDDDASSKVHNAGEEDILDVEVYEETEEDSEKGKSIDTSVENEVTSSEESMSDVGSERVEEEEDGGESEKETSVADEDKSMVPVDIDLTAEDEQDQDSKDVVKEDSSKHSVVKSVVSAAKPDARPERASVFVAEILKPLFEITAGVYYDQEEFEQDDYDDDEEPEKLTEQEINIDIENSASPKLEIVEESEVEKEEQNTKTDCNPEPCDKEPDGVCATNVMPDQSIPVLKKADAEQPKKDKDTEKPKAGRGRKNVSAKEGKKANKSSDTISANPDLEIPPLFPLPIVMSPVLPVSKLEPSPYDFDAEVDTPWHPEITKKWEPSQKSTPIVKESKESVTIPEEGDEKEKKKVKKKTKKKSISPEFVGEESSLLVDEAGSVNPSDVSASQATGDTPDSKGRKKKGRKKKEVDCEAKKEVSELYESTVNSVVEAVKHSLQETESDQEQKPLIKRRKVKHVSESDKKDTGVRITKIGRRSAGRNSTDVLENSVNLEDNTASRANSSPLHEHATPRTAHSDEAPCASSSMVEPMEDTDFKDNKTESSFMESEGFEPQLENSDPSAAFDNTPPTTPEHEEEGNRSPPMQHPEYHSHSEDMSSKSDLHKDNVKVTCSSYSPSASLPISSSNLATSKSASESPSDNDVVSTTSTDNLESAVTAQQSESSGTDQDVPSNKKRKVLDETLSSLPESKKKRVHGTRSRTAKKSPKYVGNSDSQGSTSNTPSHCPDSPPTKLADLSKSPRPCKYNFSADLGEYLEGEARCNFLITKMREIKAIYMNLKSEVASIDRRRKRARRREKESSQMTSSDKVAAM